GTSERVLENLLSVLDPKLARHQLRQESITGSREGSIFQQCCPSAAVQSGRGFIKPRHDLWGCLANLEFFEVSAAQLQEGSPVGEGNELIDTAAHLVEEPEMQ